MSSIDRVKNTNPGEVQLVHQRRFPFINYLEVLKPRETALLAFIGVCTALIGTSLQVSWDKLLLLIVALLIGSAGCNGLTNYLDRDIDALMNRTKNRVLPLKRIQPAEKSLPLIIALLVAALYLSWVLNPICVIFGIVGIAASSLWRKTITCTIFGIIAGCCPVLIGWFAVHAPFNLEIVLMCLLVALWIPIHVWSIMAARRDEYVEAGLNYLPLNLSSKTIAKVLFSLSFLLYGVSQVLYVANPLGDFQLLYLIGSNILGLAMIVASGYFLFKTTSGIAWKVYKISTFPYLGIIFLIMSLDLFIK
jgi:heme o synthase